MFLLYLVLVPAAILIAVLLGTRLLRARLRRRLPESSPGGAPSIAFLHPRPLAGGGGERVLWAALEATQARYPRSRLLVHSAWRVSLPPSISIDDHRAIASAATTAAAKFGLDISTLEFTPCDISDIAWLCDASSHPRFTLISQAIGTTLLGWIAHSRTPADILVDTANCAFALAVPRALGAVTLTYTHYPTLSIDMARAVARGEVGVNNAAANAASPLRTVVKLLYYAAFAVFYGIVGYLGVDVAIANSSWTAAHLRRTWRRTIRTVFPPCPVSTYSPDAEAEAEQVTTILETAGASNGTSQAQQALDITEGDLDNHDGDGADADYGHGLIVSVGQFRPEKRHGEQLAIAKKLRERGVRARLMMVGGARGSVDEARAAALSARAKSEKLDVEVKLNAPHAELQRIMHSAAVGLHTMREEHFGIGVVELMAAGLIVVAHASGGVATDIITHGETGFLADEIDGLADAVTTALTMSTAQRARMRAAARQSVTRFGEERFVEGFQDALKEAVTLANGKIT